MSNTRPDRDDARVERMVMNYNPDDRPLFRHAEQRTLCSIGPGMDQEVDSDG